MNKFENRMKFYLNEAQYRLGNDFSASREAMLSIAKDKVKQFQLASDNAMKNEEKEILMLMIVGSMFQAFSYGYGIGKVEEESLQKIVM